MNEDFHNIIEQFKKKFVPISDEESNKLEKVEKDKKFKEIENSNKKIIKAAKLNFKKLKLAEFSLFPDFIFQNNMDYKFTGPMGTGKTLLAHAIAKHYLKQNKKVLLLDKYRVIEAAYDISMNNLKIEELVENLDLLILDDFGQVDLTDKQKEIMNFVIGERAENDLRTVITGNFSISDIIEDTTISRMGQTYQFIDFSGDSKRNILSAENIIITS